MVRSDRQQLALNNKSRYKSGKHSPVLNCSFRPYGSEGGRWIIVISNGPGKKLYGGSHKRLEDAQRAARALNKQLGRREWPELTPEECAEWDQRMSAIVIPRQKRCAKLDPTIVESWIESYRIGNSISDISMFTGYPYTTVYYHLQKYARNCREQAQLA